MAEGTLNRCMTVRLKFITTRLVIRPQVPFPPGGPVTLVHTEAALLCTDL